MYTSRTVSLLSVGLSPFTQPAKQPQGQDVWTVDWTCSFVDSDPRACKGPISATQLLLLHVKSNLVREWWWRPGRQLGGCCQGRTSSEAEYDADVAHHSPTNIHDSHYFHQPPRSLDTPSCIQEAVSSRIDPGTWQRRGTTAYLWHFTGCIQKRIKNLSMNIHNDRHFHQPQSLDPSSCIHPSVSRSLDAGTSQRQTLLISFSSILLFLLSIPGPFLSHPLSFFPTPSFSLPRFPCHKASLYIQLGGLGIALSSLIGISDTALATKNGLRNRYIWSPGKSPFGKDLSSIVPLTRWGFRKKAAGDAPVSASSSFSSSVLHNLYISPSVDKIPQNP